jgi:hypothetical protein
MLRGVTGCSLQLEAGGGRTGARWPRKMRTHCPEATSHRRTLWSDDPVARYWHTGCHRTTSTSDWCPASHPIQQNLASRYTAVQLQPPGIRLMPPGNMYLHVAELWTAKPSASMWLYAHRDVPASYAITALNPCQCTAAGASGGYVKQGAAPASRRSDWARSVDHMRAVRSAEADAKYWPPGQAATSQTGNMWPRNVTRFAGPCSSSVLHNFTVLRSSGCRQSSIGSAAWRSNHFHFSSSTDSAAAGACQQASVSCPQHGCFSRGLS